MTLIRVFVLSGPGWPPAAVQPKARSQGQTGVVAILDEYPVCYLAGPVIGAPGRLW